MFFKRRKWALRVAEKMDLSSSDQITTELVSMIIQGSKQLNDMYLQKGSNLTKEEQILMSAAALQDNSGAINRLTNDFNISDEEALELLVKAKNAAHKLAIESKFTSLLESSWFKK